MSETTYRASVIGVGRGGSGIGGHSIGYVHGFTYQSHARTELVGAADLNQENLEGFRQSFELPEAGAAFLDHRVMLREVQPDIVSVATYVPSHRAIIEDCIQAGVKGVFCEKPLCYAWNDGLAIAKACESAGVKLIANHYRRMLDVFRTAARLIREGEIGRPVLFLAGVEGWDLMEWGSHWLDAFRLLAGDQRAESVMAQASVSGEKVRYGHVMEDHSVAYVSFPDGTRAILEGGKQPPGDFAMRCVGETGMLDILGDEHIIIRGTDGEKKIACNSTAHISFSKDQPRDDSGKLRHGYPYLIDDLLTWLEGGSEPETGISNALLSAELYLAAYESAVRGGKVQLPLGDQPVFPLEARAPL